MYHFEETENTVGTVILNDNVELSGHTVRYLKEFQISAVRFLYNRFHNREFSVLNDESGLGKTASAAVLLGIVAIKKNCLIVLANKDERINDWRFHLDMLTDLNVAIIDDEKDYVENMFNVYITKWNTLRTIGDLSKMNFDIVMLDNRQEMLNNTFCMSTLMKNFEKRVQLVISSVDVTSDVKLLHNVLRLGGCLEHHLESFKDFDKKFHLPDLKAISNKKSDLEEYFLKREILNDYCRRFRLRRYRHQFEHMLPLVDPARYKAHLMDWSKTMSLKKKKTSAIIASLPTEICTEELLQQFMSTTSHNQQQLDDEVQEITNNISINGDFNENHNGVVPSYVHDDDMNMSPLIYLSETSHSDEEKVLLSSNSIEIVIPVIEIQDDDESNDNEVYLSSKKHQIEDAPANVTKSQPEKREDAIKEKEKQKEKETAESNEIYNKKIKEIKYKEEADESNKMRITRSMHLRNHNSKKIITQPKTHNRKVATETENQSPNGVKDRKISNKRVNKNASRKSLKKSAIEIVVKREQSTAKKNISMKKKPSTLKTAEIPEIPLKTFNQCTESISATNISSVECESSGKDSKKVTPNVLNTKVRTRIRKSVGCMLGVPKRETRNMQRATRSNNKRKCFALEFDDDKIPKIRAKSKRKASSNVKSDEKSKVDSDAKFIVSMQQTTQTDANTIKKMSKIEASASIKSKNEVKTRLSSTQESFGGPPSSEYEEIQCGQKLVFDSSGENSTRILEKPNEFLTPLTPVSLHLSQYSLPQQKSRTKSTKTSNGDSDITWLSNSNKNSLEIVTLLSSSQDEVSLSSQTSNEKQMTYSLGIQKRKRYIKRKSRRQSSSFGNVLSKECTVVKSPDLFSIESDIATSNAIPFTQPHNSVGMSKKNTSFGFKIFGSEVRRLSDIPQKNEGLREINLPSDRPHFNTLENKNSAISATTIQNDKGIKATNSRLLPIHKRTLPGQDYRKLSASPTNALVTPRKPIHKCNEQTTHRSDITSDDIFEITNNATFGSKLRINANGDISPVQQLNNSQHHNKITNYLIGSGNGKRILSGDDELLGSPAKQCLAITQQLEGAAGTTLPCSRKSPKSSKSTQTTKLTKWFRRSSGDDKIKTAKRILKNPKVKTTKRRRLDLSFES